jgi:RimJ/RimL family protein N-acetyltransferase
MRYVYGHNDTMMDFISMRAKHMKREAWPPQTHTMGITTDDGKLIAAVAWHYYNQDAGVIHLSSAAISPRFGTLETIYRAYDYPFNILKCQLVMHLTPYRNYRAIEILKRFGCNYTHVPRMFGRYSDGMMLGLTEETWRRKWEARYVRTVRRHADAA